jgi:hypothetical protein
MPYTIEKARPPKKKETKEEELVKKINDPLYAIFGDYYRHLENNSQK